MNEKILLISVLIISQAFLFEHETSSTRKFHANREEIIS